MHHTNTNVELHPDRQELFKYIKTAAKAGGSADGVQLDGSLPIAAACMRISAACMRIIATAAACRYSSADPSLMRLHMSMLVQAGIGVAVCSWLPPGASCQLPAARQCRPDAMLC